MIALYHCLVEQVSAEDIWFKELNNKEIHFSSPAISSVGLLHSSIISAAQNPRTSNLIILLTGRQQKQHLI